MAASDENWQEFQRAALLRDYETRHQDRARQLERIDVFRQWEVTILAAVLSYALAQGTTSSASYLIGVIIFLFILLELAGRGNLVLMEDEIREAENSFKQNLDFQDVLKNYTFIANWLTTVEFRKKISTPLRCLGVLEFWLWHGSLIILYLVLLLVLFA